MYKPWGLTMAAGGMVMKVQSEGSEEKEARGDWRGWRELGNALGRHCPLSPIPIPTRPCYGNAQPEQRSPPGGPGQAAHHWPHQLRASRSAVRIQLCGLLLRRGGSAGSGQLGKNRRWGIRVLRDRKWGVTSRRSADRGLLP
jgi:hypothetical protein